MQNNRILAAQCNNPEPTKIISYSQNKQAGNEINVSMLRHYLDHLELKRNLPVNKLNIRSYCVVAPAEMTKQIIKLCHSDWVSGHFGLYKSHKTYSAMVLVAYLFG